MLLLLIPFIVILIYLYFTKNHDYWRKRNVKHEKPVPIFGTFFQNVMGIRSMTEIATELYNKYPDEKVVGLYRGTTPELIIRDLDLVRNILNTDFAYFHPRGLGRDVKKEPMFLNLFHVDGDPWKLLRQRLTAAFTTAKLKKMFPIIVECAEKLRIAGEQAVNRGGECDVRELIARFATDFIAACGFGLQVDSISDQNSVFRNFGKKIFNRSWKNIALVPLYDLFPDFRKLWQTLLSESTLIDGTSEIVRNVCAERNNKPSGRHDFIDLLMELREEGKIKGESIEKRNSDGSAPIVELDMDLKCMAAQVLIFFAAGFETSSSASSYLLHVLAFHPEEQEKVQQDIDQVLAKYDNKLCYDSIAEMTLLSLAFKEATRKFPSVGTLHRVCARRYTIPELGITLDPGVRIIIPVQAIQNDEKYFDNPSQFKPERFADTSVERNKYCYLPFGEGPRMCMGARLGEMQSLAGLAALLHKFSVEPSESTKRELQVNPLSNTVQSVKGGLPLKMKLRKNKTS
ncbi:cytochrome P450 6B6-like [Anticarsia gemmatalis]|uniref:cytochrome P450 6B6-like n=1 Tax=Anticarsia gemmatalis TaxID=129554 RepID=UPI003F758431